MATVFFEHASAELATLTNTFTVGSTATDPDTVTLVVTDPTGSQSTYTYAAAEITKSATGVYTKDIACTADGIWSYTWVGTGAASDVVAGTWTVFNTQLNQLYCSPEELKSRIGQTSTDTTDDLEIRLAIDAASREIDQYCNRQFWRGDDTRTFDTCSLYRVDVDDLVSVTTLSTDDDADGTFETTWTTSDYQLWPPNAASGAESSPYTRLRAVGSLMFPLSYTALARSDRVQVEGVFGWPQIPAAVKQACLLMSAEMLKLKGAPFGVAGVEGFATVRVRMNFKAAALLGPYRRHAVLVG